MSGQKLFSLYPRKRKKGKPVFYCQFKKPDGSFSTAKSTRCTSKGAAERWAIEQLQLGQIIFQENITFDKFAKDFFNWNNEWAKEKRITGKRLSEKWCDQKQRLVDSYLIPILHNVKLTSIDKHRIKNIRNDLFYNKGLSGRSVNHIMDALRQILEQAEDHSLIHAVPRVERVSSKPKQETGVLTVQEVKQLFFSTQWKDHVSYVCNLTAAITGIRKGELLGLQLKDIHRGYIEVKNTWDTQYMRLTETTKNGKSRNVVITEKLQDEIDRLISINPYGEPDSFLFFSTIIPNKPIDHKVIIKYFYRALNAIGIDEKERRARKIVFHSHRHFSNSIMVEARLPLHKIQAITGHLTDRMTEHYYHLQIDDMQDVRELQESLFSGQQDKIEENSNIIAIN